MNTDIDGIAAGIAGIFHGGYRMNIKGTLKDAFQTYPRKGTIGTFDFQCEPINYPNHYAACSGIFAWQDEYFAVNTNKYEQWGWIYRTSKNGTLVNSLDENKGDITD